MHLIDVSCGALGSFAIVGAHLPVTVGAAFAARYRGSGAVSLCFFGDGSTNIGAFHEALNLASVWDLPAIFVCENNLYGEYTPMAMTTRIERLADRADAYGMAKATVDGNDVLAVHATATEAIARAVAGDGPTLIEALTYRHKGHSRADPAHYRPEGELDRWLERDPIAVHERALRERGVDQDRLDAVGAAAERTVADALERARRGPDPRPESRLEHVFA
jgi:pyruvate dehydrogenase E1 component alpha subunit